MTDLSKIQALKMEKAHLAAQVATMTHELTQRSEEIQKYQAEQAVVLNKVQELVGYLGEMVNRVYLYDQMMESTNPSSAQQTLQILE